jgi:hypothetical protein
VWIEEQQQALADAKGEAAAADRAQARHFAVELRELPFLTGRDRDRSVLQSKPPPHGASGSRVVQDRLEDALQPHGSTGLLSGTLWNE